MSDTTAASAGSAVRPFRIEVPLEARLLLAVVDGLMFDAVTAPGTLTPAELEAALDAHLDRLLPAGGAQQRQPGRA